VINKKVKPKVDRSSSLSLSGSKGTRRRRRIHGSLQYVCICY
jgi:hypothetical protein